MPKTTETKDLTTCHTPAGRTIHIRARQDNRNEKNLFVLFGSSCFIVSKSSATELINALADLLESLDTEPAND